MKDITIELKNVAMDESWDVIVAGGGPAGCTAAAAAAREGARTLLIEATGALGGMGTTGLVPAWCPFSDGEKVIYRGMAERVLRESNKGTFGVKEEQNNWVPIDPENLKAVYDNLVTGSGASILFNTQVVDVRTAGPGEADMLLLANKGGITAVKAGVYVDCTGDADIAARSGAEVLKGDENGDLQPATHCFAFGNVNLHEREKHPKLHGRWEDSPIHDILSSGKYPLIPDSHLCNNPVGQGTIGFNAGHLWDVDNTDPQSVSAALVKGRKMAAQFLAALKEAQPAVFKDAYLAKTGELLGIRETRRVMGDYFLTVDDFTGLKSFDDEIGRNCYFIDVHHKKTEVKTDKEIGIGHHISLNKGESHGIPYRCLTPKGVKNVLVAGRSISTDRPVNGSVRVMPVCLVTGEAAGLAAALAVKHNGNDIHAVDTNLLRKRLRAEGAWLPEHE